MFVPNTPLMFPSEDFNPADLFLLGEDGAWYDPSDLTTLWQDTSATTPVTSDGQSVARIDDKSGNGRHLIQATASSRPTYKTSGGLHWLDFDGGDWLYLDVAGANITSGGGGLAVSATSDQVEAVQGLVEEVEPATSSDRTVILFDTRATPRRLAGYQPDGSSRFIDLDAEISGAQKVFIFSSDGTSGEGYINNVQYGSSITTTATFSADSIINLGRQQGGSLNHDGKIYGAILLDRGFTVSERMDVNSWLGSKAGI
jgi:hypothetical protein